MRSLLIAVPLLAVVAIGWQAAGKRSDLQEAGRALYNGESALVGRIVGHDMDLPGAASRCVNCHGTVPNTGAATLAPSLAGEMLTGLKPRRGGPPSRYDSATFCKLLRNGVDPAHVMIPRTMPRYTVSDADCSALWAYLSSH